MQWVAVPGHHQHYISVITLPLTGIYLNPAA